MEEAGCEPVPGFFEPKEASEQWMGVIRYKLLVIGLLLEKYDGIIINVREILKIKLITNNE